MTKLDLKTIDQYASLENISKDDKNYEHRFDECMLNHIVSMIDSGAVKVRYKAWSFSGGRDYGDCDIFEFYDPKDENYNGTLDINRSFDEIEFTFTGIDGKTQMGSVREFCDDDLDTINAIVNSAVLRDDKSFVNAVNVVNNGNTFGYPRAYNDVMREDIFSNDFDSDMVAMFAPLDILRYKGRFGEFNYNPDDVNYVLDDLNVSEEYHSKWLGEVPESYIDAIYDILDHDYEKYEYLVADWDFSNGTPEGYISSEDQNQNVVKRVSSGKKQVDVSKVLAAANDLDDVESDNIKKGIGK